MLKDHLKSADLHVDMAADSGATYIKALQL